MLVGAIDATPEFPKANPEEDASLLPKLKPPLGSFLSDAAELFEAPLLLNKDGVEVELTAAVDLAPKENPPADATESFLPNSSPPEVLVLSLVAGWVSGLMPGIEPNAGADVVVAVIVDELT